MGIAKWGRYANFSKEEFDCQETGENEMQHAFMVKLQTLRDVFGNPMVVSSGYRSPAHSIEARKAAPGTHTQGIAVDIAIDREDAVKLLRLALSMGFTGIGIQQKGSGRFIHLDTRNQPTIWSY
jgi:uncharacterized protein YcbK (DUF882 family)